MVPSRSSGLSFRQSHHNWKMANSRILEFLVIAILDQKYVSELPVGGAGGVHHSHVQRSLYDLPVSMHAVHDYDYWVHRSLVDQ